MRERKRELGGVGETEGVSGIEGMRERERGEVKIWVGERNRKIQIEIYWNPSY